MSYVNRDGSQGVSDDGRKGPYCCSINRWLPKGIITNCPARAFFTNDGNWRGHLENETGDEKDGEKLENPSPENSSQSERFIKYYTSCINMDGILVEIFLLAAFPRPGL